MPGTNRVRFEGDFDRFFVVYVRTGLDREEIPAPRRGLQRRCAWWATAIGCAVIGGLLAFAHLLGWALDR